MKRYKYAIVYVDQYSRLSYVEKMKCTGWASCKFKWIMSSEHWRYFAHGRFFIQIPGALWGEVVPAMHQINFKQGYMNDSSTSPVLSTGSTLSTRLA
jgi:hypothetical protein